MPDTPDMDLIRAYAEHHSEPAFRELVQRHLNLVYSIALRFVGHGEDAQDVAQAVFIILAKKAGGLRAKTVLTGWLYETTRFTAMNFLTSKTRRQRREHEAYMQSTLTEAGTGEAWRQLAPHLEDGMARLGAADRALLALRYYENKTGTEAAALLGIRQDAVHKRTLRAVAKLRKFLLQRGVALSAAAIVGAVSANSLQAAPATLAKTISAVAVTKGAAATTTTLTLVKGALKIMAWSKMNTAIVVGAGILLMGGATTVTIKEIQAHTLYAWQDQGVNSDVLRKTPPQVRIVPEPKFSVLRGGSTSLNDGPGSGSIKTMGLSELVGDIVASAYGQSGARIVFLTPMPPGKFDYIANLPSGNFAALQREIARKFGLVGRRELWNTNVLRLTVRNSSAPGLLPGDPARLKPHSGSSWRSGAGYLTSRSQNLRVLGRFLEDRFGVPVVDATGLAKSYDIDLNWDEADYRHPNLDGLKQSLLDQLGLELTPTNLPIELLVVRKAP